MGSQRVGDRIRFGIAEDKLHFFGPDQRRIAKERA
jgi:hypothetical protein